ncbi:MAG TPA: hypothetical protein DC038_01345, partial [Clostridiales bacterium]|nr:hypothetical protein [Clostridiales bacterium]
MEKIKRAKGISIVLLFMMVFQLMMPVNFAYGDITSGEDKDLSEYSLYSISGSTTPTGIQVTARGVGPQSDLGNIFDFAHITINGNPISDDDIITINADTTANIRFTWDTEGLDAKNGDTAEIQLSDAFTIVTTPRAAINVDGTKVGEYWIDGGVLKFEFNENIEQGTVKNGWVELGLKFNLEKFKENIEQEIPFHDGSEHNITVIARPNLTHKGITKEGHPNSKENAREITWTIDVINTNDEKVENAKLEDDIPVGLGAAKNFVINKLHIGIDGKITKGDEVTLTPVTTAFPINLGTMAPFTGYRVQFTTNIEDYTETTFTNKATFSYNGKDGLPAEGTVGGLTRSNPIEKKGSRIGNTDNIEWTIDVNKNGQEIEKAIVEDALPEGLKIVPGTIKVFRISQSGNTWTPGASHGTTFTGFPIDLGPLTPSVAYRIVFETTVDWSKVNSGEYQINNGFKNTATLFDDNDELNHADATVNINRGPILEKIGVDNVNYDNKTITWTVTVNKAKHPLNTVTVTDILPAGLKLLNLSNPVVITTDATENYTSYSTATGTVSDPPNGDKTKLEITLNNVGTQTLTIKYTTEITNFNINSFGNTVGMSGTGVGTGGSDRVVTVNPKANTYTKGYVGINYNEKTIDWRLTVDPRREAIATLKIEDTFPNKGMILLPETVTVTLKGNTLTKGTDYTLAPRTEGGETGYHKGFIISVPEAGSSITSLDGGQLIINYKTSYDPEVAVDGNKLEPHIVGTDQSRIYNNRTHFTGTTQNSNPINETRNAQITVKTESWNSGKKEGQLVHFDGEGKKVNGWVSGAERKIAWQLYLNYQKQNLGSNVSVTDTLAYTGVIDEGSIKVSVYEVAADGTTSITPSTELTLGDDYSVTVEGDKFTLIFKKAVTERYVIEFTTSVPNVSQQIYTNNAEVTVGSTKYPYAATLDYDKHNAFLKKGALGVTNNSVFTGEEVEWRVTVNESLSIISNAVVTDTISSGHVYVNDSLKVFRLSGTQEIPITAVTDYSLDVSTTDDGKTVLAITLSETLKDTLVLRYTTVVTETNGEIGNSISLDGTGISKKEIESSKLSAEQWSSAGGEWAKDKGALRVTKIDSETREAITTNQATFTLWYNLNNVKVQFGDTEYTTVKGVLEIGNLPLRTYYLREIAAPTGYVLADEDLSVVVDKVIGNNVNNPIVAEGTFENTKEKIDITGTKEWNGGSAPRPTVWFKLYRQLPGGALKEVPGAEIKELANGTTEVTWEDVDKTNINGVGYIYSIKEVTATGADFTPENYVKAENGLKVTNSYNSPTDASAKATKVWAGEPEGRQIGKPTIWFKLYRYVEDGELEAVPGAEIKELADGKVEVVWTGLTKTDVNGKEYSFLVKEVDVDGNDFVPENYNKSEEGLTVTNTYTKRDVTATKVWSGGSSPRPTIWFELYRQIEGGELEKVNVAIQELADGTTEVTWEDLDKTDEDGNEYIYSVKEVDGDGKDFVPSGYKKSEVSLTVTNTKTSSPGGGGETTPVYGKVTVKKVDEDKKVLSGAEFTLYDSKGKVVGKAVTGSDGTVSFEELGPGEYVLKETKAPEGYVLDDKETDVTISANKTNSYTFTNRKEEPKKPGRIEIIKTDEEGKLLSDAWFSLIDEKGSTLQNAGTVNGRVAFEDVPVGRYTVKEVQAPEGYELSGKAVTVTVESNRTVELSFVNKKSGTPVVPAN